MKMGNGFHDLQELFNARDLVLVQVFEPSRGLRDVLQNHDALLGLVVRQHAPHVGPLATYFFGQLVDAIVVGIVALGSHFEDLFIL